MKQNLILLVIYLMLSIGFVQIQNNNEYLVGYHKNVIENTKEQYGSRVLIPFVFEYAEKLSQKVYPLGREMVIIFLYKTSFAILTAITILLFQQYLQNWFTKETAIIASLILLASFPFAFYNGGGVDSVLNLAVFVICADAIVKKRFWMLYWIIPFAALNRETVLFIPFMYFLSEYSFDNKFKIFRNTVLLGFLAVIPQLLIKLVRGLLTKTTYSDRFVWNFACHQCYVSIFLLFNIFWIFAFWNWANKPHTIKRWLILVPFFILAHYHFGFVHELRMFLPLAVIIIPSAVFEMQKALS